MTTKVQPSRIDTTLNYTFANVTANSVIVTNGIVANGTVGNDNQVLTSNGTVSYWANTSSGGADAATVITLSFLTAGM